MMPPIIVIATTYFPPGSDGALRREAAVEAMDSWALFLAPVDAWSPHMADDGSYWTNAVQTVGRPHMMLGFPDTRQERHGVGASLNAAIAAHPEADLFAYFVDDWKLTAPFDLTPWAQLLRENDDVGMVRFGPPHPDLTGRVRHFPGLTQDWALQLDRHHFAYAHRPALYHRRFFEAYGPFAEDVNAYECERLYNEKFCSAVGSHYKEAFAGATGPDIVLALPHPWQHIESVELAGVEPRAEYVS